VSWGAQLEKQHALVRLEREWGDIRKNILINFGPETNKRIPKFVQRFAKQMHDTDRELHRALMNGDMAWFASWNIRLDQMDNGLVQAGFDSEYRMPIERARWFLKRLSLLAIQRLEQLGGEWPPVPRPSASS